MIPHVFDDPVYVEILITKVFDGLSKGFSDAIKYNGGCYLLLRLKRERPSLNTS